MARGKKHTSEQIVNLLRQVEVGMANRWEAVTEQGCRVVGIGHRFTPPLKSIPERRQPLAPPASTADLKSLSENRLGLPVAATPPRRRPLVRRR